MKYRTMPFGYTWCNGSPVINHKESSVVTLIFNNYIGGMSLQAISDYLTKREIPYTESNCLWNRARVMHIINDLRYTGKNGFPAIIPADVFETAQKTKNNRSSQQEVDRTQEIYKIKPSVICPYCGSVMRRRNEVRLKCKQKWMCTDSTCKTGISISDENLLSKISSIMKFIISNTDMITCCAETDDAQKKTVKPDNKFVPMGCQLDIEPIVSELLQNVTTLYEEIDDTPYTTEMLRSLISRSKITDSISPELINNTVRQINLHPDATISLVLLNGQEITKDGFNNVREPISARA